MSVAFRRETDEEHREPRPELPIPPGPNLVTAAGFALIAARVAELEATLAATEDEDAIKVVRRDLRYWHARRATARVMPPATGDEAVFGSQVRYRLDGIVHTVAIVGDDEADPPAGLVSFTAPLARALLGCGAGDRADFAGREEAIEVLAVGPR